MKIITDNALELTRADWYKNENENEIKIKAPEENITHTAIDAFTKYFNGDKEELRDIISIKEAKSINESLQQYKELRKAVADNPDLRDRFDPIAVAAIRSEKTNFENILLNKITYELDQGEDPKKIMPVLSNQNSGALYREYSYDENSKRITAYESRNGLWEVGGNVYTKYSEMRRAGDIRRDNTLRQISDPMQLKDAKRITYSLFEDSKALIEAGVVNSIYSKSENIHGDWLEDPSYKHARAIHYKEELTQEDLAKIQAMKEAEEQLKKETTHTNKPQAKNEEVAATADKNEEEIHTKHEVDINVEADQTIQQKTEHAVEAHMAKLMQEFEASQKRDAEAMKLKIAAAMGEERATAKKTFLRSLNNGMTVEEAIGNLQAAKHNDMLIAAVLEEIKSDMLLSIEKDGIISDQKNHIKITEKTLENTEAKLEVAETARKTNYENYQREQSLRKEREGDLQIKIQTIKEQEEILQSLVVIQEKMKSKIAENRIEIVELKETTKERDKTIDEQTRELDAQFDKITHLEAENKKQKETIAIRDNAIIERDNIIGTLQNKITQLEENENKLKIQITQLETAARQNHTAIEHFKKSVDDLESKVTEHQKSNKNLQAENELLSQKLAVLKSENEGLRGEIREKQNRVALLEQLVNENKEKQKLGEIKKDLNEKEVDLGDLSNKFDNMLKDLKNEDNEKGDEE